MNGLGLRTGELFPGAADRFAWEIEPPGLVEPLANVPDDIASLVEVAGENSLCRMTAETCRRAPGKVPDLLDHKESACLAALQIESACSMHSSAFSLS